MYVKQSYRYRIYISLSLSGLLVVDMVLHFGYITERRGFREGELVRRKSRAPGTQACTRNHDRPIWPTNGETLFLRVSK